MAYIAFSKGCDIHHVILEEYPEGVYVFVFYRIDSKYPEEDHLQDDLDMAMRACLQDYSIPNNAWKEIPNPNLR